MVLESIQRGKPHEKDSKAVLPFWNEQSPEPEAGWEVLSKGDRTL